MRYDISQQMGKPDSMEQYWRMTAKIQAVLVENVKALADLPHNGYGQL